MSEQESFWNDKCFAVITDKTKSAMKLTIDELKSRGKDSIYMQCIEVQQNYLANIDILAN